MSTITLNAETVGVPTQLLIGGRWIDCLGRAHVRR